MPIQTISGAGIDYYLILFNAQGQERTDAEPNGAPLSQRILNDVRQDAPSDIFLFSHGWKGDVPSAIDQYDRWIGAMWKLEADRSAMGAAFKPLFIGLHWPSLPWGEETVPAQPASFGINGSPDLGGLIDKAVEHFGAGEVTRPPLTVIFEAFAADPAAKVVPPAVVAAYQELGKAIGFSANSDMGAAPDSDGAPLDPQAALKAERLANAAQAFGIGSTIKNGILAGLRQTSFWLMKHRARTVGEQGMHAFVGELQKASNARIHLMGHSFGCIVVSSILGGPNGNSPLPRPVDSAALVQGALSLWSFGERIPYGDMPGYFHKVLTSGAVKGPVATTQSTNDAAVGLAYPAAVGLVDEFSFGNSLPKFGGVGTWGIQGIAAAESLKMQNEREAYSFKPRGIYNIDGSLFIPSHSGIDGPQVAHLLWQVARAGVSA